MVENRIGWMEKLRSQSNEDTRMEGDGWAAVCGVGEGVVPILEIHSRSNLHKIVLRFIFMSQPLFGDVPITPW